MHSDPNIERFYKSGAWRKCRAAFLADKSGLCEICLGKGLIVPATEVHHKIILTSDNINNPDVTLNHANLMALCDDCHQAEHKQKRWRCCEDGHIEIRR